MSWRTTNLVLWACEKQNENILRECIEMKYNLNEETMFFCKSSLMIATIEDQNINIIKLLVNNGADLNHVNYYAENVCNFTVNPYYLSFFQSIGVEKVKNTTKRMTKLALEIKNSYTQKKCLPTTKDQVNQLDAIGLTPFLWAIFHERLNYIDYYLELGADVNQAGKTGITPLMMAVRLGNFGLVKKLVEKGANINQLDNYGRSAIAYYYYEDNTKILDCLFENGAQIDPCPSSNGRSPLMIVTIQNLKNAFDSFLNENANVNFIDSDGNSVLSYAILNENTEDATILIAKGADVDACGPKGKTPLAWSVFLNNPEITQFLLDKGANINYIDHQGKTALDYAEKYQYTEIAKLLKNNGAND